MRLRRRAGTKEYLAGHANLVSLAPEEHRGKWHHFFGNDHPIHVELGMGKGQFISELSASTPEVNFIGIDMYDELVRRSFEKANEHWQEEKQSAPTNLKLALCNIEKIETVFAEGEIERIYLNFSDPWPKKRHAHRRLTHPVFLEKYKQILNANGEIHMKTDSRSLFEFSLNSFVNENMVLQNIHLDLHADGPFPGIPLTEYEQKFMNEGLNIHRCEVVVGSLALARRTERLNELKARRD